MTQHKGLPIVGNIFLLRFLYLQIKKIKITKTFYSSYICSEKQIKAGLSMSHLALVLPYSTIALKEIKSQLDFINGS